MSKRELKASCRLYAVLNSQSPTETLVTYRIRNGGTMFEKINYQDLTAKQKEIFNFQKVAAILADYGYNCIKLADDWQGADFLAYHNNGEDTLKVQLKGRVTINKKYFGKAIWMAFPLDNVWYLIEHDVLLSYVEETTNWLDTSSWLEGGAYSAKAPNKKLMERLRVHQL